MGRKRKNNKHKINQNRTFEKFLGIVIVAAFIVCGLYFNDNVSNFIGNVENSIVNEIGITAPTPDVTTNANQVLSFDLESIPEFDGSTPYVIINDNNPEFAESYFTTNSFESYSDLDSFGRCGTAFANISKDTMPTEERGEIGSVKPSGWYSIKYDIVDGKYLYNRCHLIGYQLAGENANEKNLITGTRYLNIEGMLPFENEIADYVDETDNHVLYRVTPIFEEENLLASGVQMEAESVEDRGEGVKFNVYVYNAQPGIFIDYATGDSRLAN